MIAQNIRKAYILETSISPLRPLIIYAHNPTVRPECQVQAQAAIARLVGGGWDVEEVITTEEHSYWAAFAARWGRRDIINIEQDIVATESQVSALAACPEDACTVPYHLKTGHWSIYDVVRSSVVSYAETLPARAAGSGLGLVKLSAYLQRHMPLSSLAITEPVPWWHMDMYLSHLMWTNGWDWHVHPGPARHVRPNVD